MWNNLINIIDLIIPFLINIYKEVVEKCFQIHELFDLGLLQKIKVVNCLNFSPETVEFPIEIIDYGSQCI